MTTRPVLTSVSLATRPLASSVITASSTPSEIWSQILSGCPSVTDSEVNRYSLSARSWNSVILGSPRLLDVQEKCCLEFVLVASDGEAERLQFGDISAKASDYLTQSERLGAPYQPFEVEED